MRLSVGMRCLRGNRRYQANRCIVTKQTLLMPFWGIKLVVWEKGFIKQLKLTVQKPHPIASASAICSNLEVDYSSD
jgi:hypothetical protein